MPYLRVCVVIATAVLLPTVASAQPFGYATGSIIWPFDPYDFGLQVGAGGETSATGVALDGDLDLFHAPARAETFARGYSYLSAWTGSAVTVNVVDHFDRTYGAGVRPFIVGGLTLLPGSESLAWLHVGAGIDRWITSRTGVRFGGSAMVAPTAWPPILSFRVSMLFR